MGILLSITRRNCRQEEMISMSSLFDDLKEGLEEAIAYESGNDSK